jgi:hypothetical protein
MSKQEAIGIYRKTGPTTRTVLGPGPPPEIFNKFYRFYGFFAFLGLQYSRKNRHQCRHLQPTPPRKVSKSDIFRKLSIFIDFIRPVLFDHDSWLRKIVRDSIYTFDHFLKIIDDEQLGSDKFMTIPKQVQKRQTKKKQTENISKTNSKDNSKTRKVDLMKNNTRQK